MDENERYVRDSWTDVRVEGDDKNGVRIYLKKKVWSGGDDYEPFDPRYRFYGETKAKAMKAAAEFTRALKQEVADLQGAIRYLHLCNDHAPEIHLALGVLQERLADKQRGLKPAAGEGPGA